MDGTVDGMGMFASLLTVDAPGTCEDEPAKPMLFCHLQKPDRSERIHPKSFARHRLGFTDDRRHVDDCRCTIPVDDLTDHVFVGEIRR
jgi:hypothetical protein